MIQQALQTNSVSGDLLESISLARHSQNTPGLTVIVCPDMSTVSRLAEEIPFFWPEAPLLTFPDWETLPYDHFSPHPDIISQRLTTLFRLPLITHGLLIVPISTLMQRIAPPDFLQGHCFILKEKDRLSLDTLRKQLEKSGYRCVSQVMEHGEFAIRGSLLDLFPMGSSVPYRIDLLDEEIDSLRTFDPDTQRSLEKQDRIELLPAHEFPLSPNAITAFRQRWRNLFPGNPTHCPLYEAVSRGIAPAGIEYYLPLFFDHTATLRDYFPAQHNFIVIGDPASAAEKFFTEVEERYEEKRHDDSRPVLTPDALFLKPKEVREILNKASSISSPASTLPTLSPHGGELQKTFSTLEHFIADYTGRILFCAESLGRREALREVLKNIALHPVAVAGWNEFLTSTDTFCITVAPLEKGFLLDEICVITETELLGQPVLQQRRRKVKAHDPETVIRNLNELTLEAPVVHLEHGVGRYKGLKTLEINNITSEFLTLEYAHQALLYVPVSSLHLISRYCGLDPEHIPLHTLGTEQWQKAKRKAIEQIRDVAAELLSIYAQRAARKGFAFRAPENAYQTFATSFPFETTPDQQQAIEQVLNDMVHAKPMDRLICGDVGFGKTEVAMRAAFLAVQSGKQVAILVPTTLLAQQHYQNFCDRFAEWPVRIEVLSRFRSRTALQAITQDLRENKVDIVIGTHALLQSDIQFSNLGLVIIDEEHRFGVHQKERLKALRSEVDILTLTATPIPRTLNLALSGLRDLSIIATPPAKRLSIKTFRREYNKTHIREAVLREILRGGQVYYLHNDVRSIEKTRDQLQMLVPEARIAIAHGQLRERELERIMADFYHQRFNLLLCTTIIETGIDVPSANTIIIERADKFGLAQLHQLRGRVGRSHHQAYAYLLTPPEEALTADAIKRLDAITSLEDLGAGFTLASHDLEIRGAGELLGDAQSGDMQAIGFTLYTELLDRAVKTLQAGKTFDVNALEYHGAEIDLQIPALIPEAYVPDIHLRLILYKRISNAENNAALDELKVEMIDRFGELPSPVQNLFHVARLKLQARPLGIRKLEAGPKGGKIEFDPHPTIDPAHLISLIQKQPHRFKLAGATLLKFFWDAEKAEIRINETEQLLKIIG